MFIHLFKVNLSKIDRSIKNLYIFNKKKKKKQIKN